MRYGTPPSIPHLFPARRNVCNLPSLLDTLFSDVAKELRTYRSNFQCGLERLFWECQSAGYILQIFFLRTRQLQRDESGLQPDAHPIDVFSLLCRSTILGPKVAEKGISRWLEVAYLSDWHVSPALENTSPFY